jgi:hypothetical protein
LLKTTSLEEMGMNTRRFCTLAVALLAVLAAVPALADDLNPPWWRGLEGTTFQEWTFDQPGNAPANVNNPYGDPQLLTQGQWLPTGQLVSRDLSFVIPNRRVPDPHKYIRIQATYSVPTDVTTELQLHIQSEPQAEWEVFGHGVQPGTDPTQPTWYSWWDIVMKPNPYIEYIWLGAIPGATWPVYWDQVVIDTWCQPIPEPMSMTLAGLGLAGVFGGRRLRKR